MMHTVTITILEGRRRQYMTRHRSGNQDMWDVVEKAVQKRWGKNAGFSRDNSISVGKDPRDGTQYGQVGLPARGGGTNMITGKVSVRVD